MCLKNCENTRHFLFDGFNLHTVKLIASDMDGTLLDGDGNLDPSFFSLYKKIEENGCLFVAASGRQYYNLRKIFDPIKDNIVFIAENGTYVAYKSKELLVDSIDKDSVDEMVDDVRKINGALPVVCGKNSAYIEDADNEVFVREVRKYYERCKIVSDLKQPIDDEILKIAVYDFSNSLDNSYPQLKHFDNRFKVVVSGVDWVDISSAKANKGEALALVQNYFQIEPAATLVFGDQMNDLEMMSKGYFSFAMENAVEGIKNAANFVAPSNTNNGVFKIISMLTQLK